MAAVHRALQGLAGDAAAPPGSWAQVDAGAAAWVRAQVPPPSSRTVADALLRAGWATRRTDGGGALGHWWALPHTGRLLKHLAAGRREVCRLVKRAQFGEALRRALESKSGGELKTSPLGTAWHVRDALGLGLLQAADTASGPLLSTGLRAGGRARTSTSTVAAGTA